MIGDTHDSKKKKKNIIEYQRKYHIYSMIEWYGRILQ